MLLANIQVTVQENHPEIGGEKGFGTRMRQPERPPERPDGADLHVLIVDKSQALRDALQDILQHHGYETTAWETEPEALKALTSTPHQLAIVEYHLASMTGLEFIAHMRESGHGIPAIILSSPRTSDRKATCLMRGAAAFFVKPFRVDEIIEAVRRFINSSSQ